VKSRSPLWIEQREVLAIHERVLALHGGAQGVRDRALLESALARPQHHATYVGSDLVDMAAQYTAGIIRNHPFVDGNKRTGFVVGIVFLEVNEYAFTAPEQEATAAVSQLAAGELNETEYAAWLRANVKRRRRC